MGYLVELEKKEFELNVKITEEGSEAIEEAVIDITSRDYVPDLD